MKKIVMIVLMISLIFSGCANTDGNSISKNIEIEDYTELFASKIHDIHIQIETSDYEDLLSNPLEETYYKVDLTVDDEILENVAFRTKGNSTLRSVANSTSDRYSYKINVSKYEDQELYGLDEFVLNNMFSDPSFMREYISYTAMRENGAIVPLVSYANVSINETLKGLYLMVETVDDSFLKRQFGNNDGNLYRCDQGTTLLIKDGTYVESVEQKNGSDESKADLYAFMDVLNAMPVGEKGDIETVLDVNSALNYFAVNTVMQSYDSYNGQFAQNFYLYNNDGIFTVIPWDYNMSIGTFGSGDMTDSSISEPIINTSLSERPLIENLLAVEAYREIYYEYVQAYVDYFEDFENQVSELKSLIEDSVLNDPTKFSTNEQFEATTVYQEDGDTAVNMMNNQRPGAVDMRPDQRNSSEMLPDMEEGQMPEGFNQNQQDMNGQQPNQQPPNQGGRPDFNENMPINRDGKDDLMMSGNSVSIINIMKARLEAIKIQLEALGVK